MNQSWLVAIGSKTAHIAKMGTASVYAIGKNPSKPENGEVLCGKNPDWWSVATLDLVGFGSDRHPDYEECGRCHLLQFNAQQRLERFSNLDGGGR